MTEFEAYWSASEVQMARHLDQASKRHPLERHWMTTSQRVQVDVVTVKPGNHGQTGEPALGRFRLLDNGQVAAAGEIQKTSHVHVLMLSRGSSNQRINERFSRTMSARKSISACSAIFLP